MMYRGRQLLKIRALQNVYNMDEFCVQMTTRKGAVIVARGSKRVPQLATAYGRKRKD